MAELLLSDHPWILAVLYAVESVVNGFVVSHVDGFRGHVQRNSCASTDERNLSGQQVNVVVKVQIRGLIEGVFLLLLCAYWDVVPRSVFLLLIGVSVVMCACNLLLINLPSLIYWGMLCKAGYREESVDPSSRPIVMQKVIWYAGCSFLFILCWALTGSLIFLGTAVSAIFRSLGFTRKVFGVESPDDENASSLASDLP